MGLSQKIHEAGVEFSRTSVYQHPFVLHLLVALQRSVLICSNLEDSLRPIQVIDIQPCHMCKLSQQGQYFAITTKALLLVYDTYTRARFCIRCKGIFKILFYLSGKMTIAKYLRSVKMAAFVLGMLHQLQFFGPQNENSKSVNVYLPCCINHLLN